MHYFALLLKNSTRNKTIKDSDGKKKIHKTLKVVFATFFLVCFVCLKDGTCETKKNVFYSLRKLFLFLR